MSPGSGALSARDALHRVTERVAAAARRAGRDPSEVVLVGVTKTVPPQRIREAVHAGLRHLGENRVQEAAAKIQALADLAGITWHLVGHLQSNKARRAADLFSWIHSVDSPELARRLQLARPGLPGPLAVLIQVDLGGEPTKHGVEASRLRNLADEVSACSGLRLRGLMTIPPLSADPEASRPYFSRLRDLRDKLASGGLVLPDLSMGMSGDLEVAVEEGATLVRVGRSLFGERASAG